MHMAWVAEPCHDKRLAVVWVMLLHWQASANLASALRGRESSVLLGIVCYRVCQVPIWVLAVIRDPSGLFPAEVFGVKAFDIPKDPVNVARCADEFRRDLRQDLASEECSKGVELGSVSLRHY